MLTIVILDRILCVLIIMFIRVVSIIEPQTNNKGGWLIAYSANGVNEPCHAWATPMSSDWARSDSNEMLQCRNDHHIRKQNVQLNVKISHKNNYSVCNALMLF